MESIDIDEDGSADGFDVDSDSDDESYVAEHIENPSVEQIQSAFRILSLIKDESLPEAMEDMLTLIHLTDSQIETFERMREAKQKRTISTIKPIQRIGSLRQCSRR